MVGLVLPSMAPAAELVTLQFTWSHGFQFAGYHAALAQGYDRQAGLDVRFLEAVPGKDPLDAVLDGQAQYGVGTSSLLLARKAGKPVVVMAASFRHSPLVLIARRQRGIDGLQAVHDIVGKRVMIEPQSDELIANHEFIALLRNTHHASDALAVVRKLADALLEPCQIDGQAIQVSVSTGIALYPDAVGHRLISRRGRAWPRRPRASAVDGLVLGLQFFRRFHEVGVLHDAVGRAHQLALRFVFGAHTFGAAQRVDHVQRVAHADGFVGAHGLAGVAGGAVVVDE